MKKQTKVLVAATLLTLGASFSSLAALKNGTWVPSEEGWQYADKEGEFVESEWAMSNGVQFWINDEGYLGANEWVSDDKHSYYVQSDGSMAVNAWKYVYGEDDEDADEESWFYFDAKGRMVKEDTKDINGVTYYFDENGKMLTGWIDTVEFNNVTIKDDVKPGKVVFADENGAVLKKAWINEFQWGVDTDNLYEGEDEKWFYAGKNGFLATGMQKDIAGHKYFFNTESGEMLEGWVYEVAGAYTTDSNAGKIDNYFYATEDIGYAKKNGWKEIDDTWFYFDKLGRAFAAKNGEGVNVWDVDFNDGEINDVASDADAKAVKYVSKKIDGVKYYFNAEGEMLDGLVDINGKVMYLVGGEAQTGKVTLTDENENEYTFYFVEKGEKKGEAANGNYAGYCYSKGQLMTSEESGVYKLVTVENVGDFIVDYRGKIQHNDNKVYEGVSEEKYNFNEKLDGVKEDSINYDAE